MPSATVWLLLIAGLLVYAVKREEFSRPTLVRPTAQAPSSRAAEPIDAGSGQADPEPLSLPSPAAPAVPQAPTVQACAASSAAQELMAGLFQLARGEAGAPRDPEALKRAFKLLTGQGPAAVPAIQAYLERFQDLDFDPAAASDVLAQALNGQWDRRNIAPVFEVLQKYGDESVVSLLEHSVGKWNYYGTLALAGLPDGAGIAPLIRSAQDPSVRSAGTGDFALRPLAQAAMQYPDARSALIEQARLNQIADTAWPTVAASLAGTYIQYGNQLLGRTVPAVSWSAEEVQSRVALLDQMLAVTSNPAGQLALRNARTLVLSKTSQR